MEATLPKKNLTFKDIAELFVQGATSAVSGGSGNVIIKHDQLFHYSTVIAERAGNKILLNVSRYSLQTGKLQKVLREVIPGEKIKEVRMVPKNYKDSLSLLDK